MPKEGRRGKKRRRAVLEASKEEEDLAALVFGTDDSSKAAPAEAAPAAWADEDDGGKAEEADEEAAAWDDSDDEQVQVDISAVPRLRKLRRTDSETVLSGKEYEQRLRNRFQQGAGNTWATLDGEESSKVLTSSASLASAGVALPSKRLEMKRLKDANTTDMSKAVVQSVHFHPSGQVMLTAGYDKRLRLFQVDGIRNPKIESVFLPDLPIRTARFVSGGRQVACSGRRPFWYDFDVESGKVTKIDRIIGRKEKSLEKFVVSPSSPYMAFFGNHGYMVLVSTRTKHWVANLKMNGSVRAASFSADGKELFACGGDGEVYRWDLRSQRPLARHHDEGSTGCSAIAVSPVGGMYAVGSESGVVNLYNSADATAGSTSAFGTAQVKPVKSLMHLTTAVDQLQFNHDGQILAMGSQRARDSLKMVHTASRSVFGNWPTSKTPLHYIATLDFSPSSGYLAIGNDRGRALLYRLQHYSSA